MKAAVLVILLAFGIAVAGTAPVSAQTPDAEGYMLLEPAFPAVIVGSVVPVFVHLEFEKRNADGGTMRLSFITVFQPDGRACREDGDCERIDRPVRLSYRIENGLVQADVTFHGNVEVTGRPASRSGIVLPMIEAIVGARMRQTNGRLVFEDVEDEPAIENLIGPAVFAPATLGETVEAMLLTTMHDLSLNRTGPCPQKRLADIRGSTAPTDEERDLLAALRYARLISDTQDRAAKSANTEQQFDTERRALSRLLGGLSVGVGMTAAELSKNPDASDDALLETRASVTEKVTAGGRDLHQEAGDWADDAFLALVRYRVHADALRAAGEDLGRALCSDPTLSSGRP